MNELHRPRRPNTLRGKIVNDPTMTPVALPFVLIVVPTRELAIQVFLDMCDLSVGNWIQPGCLYGGTSRKDQASSLASGCDILVATPGRLIDMLQGSYVDGVKTVSLENLSHIVWDEADELLSLGFADQMKQILDLAMFNGYIHHWFFSSQYQEEHTDKAKSLIDGVYLDISFDMPEENAAIRYFAVKQIFIEVGTEQQERFDAIEKIIGNNSDTKCIVLCETHAAVEELHLHLNTLDIPFRSTHGGLNQERREDAMFRFKKNVVPILVSTMGISGRGPNTKGVDYLIFWDMPKTLEQYKWCLGRVSR